MRYIVHVIDNVSGHENTENGFVLTNALDTENHECHVLVSDSFYCVEAEKPLDAVVEISNIIKINPNLTLTEAFLKTKKSFSSTDFSSDLPEDILSETNLVYSTKAYSHFFQASCHIERNDGNDRWIELHKVSFFIVEENKIMEIKK